MGNLEQRGRSSKVAGKSQEIGFFKVLQIDPCLWKESKQEDTNKEGIGSYNGSKERIYAEEGESVFVFKRGERRST